MPRTQKRTSTWRLLRALWRYRGRIAGHSDRFQAEVATAVRTALEQALAGRLALRGYRIAMRVLLIVGIVLVVGAIVAGVLLRHHAAIGALVVIVLLGPGIWALVLRFAWGAPLDWLNEFDDPAREVPIAELPARLRDISRELRDLTDVPGSISRELDELAGDVETAQGPHVIEAGNRQP
jgi:hypothetical protein